MKFDVVEVRFVDYVNVPGKSSGEKYVFAKDFDALVLQDVGVTIAKGETTWLYPWTRIQQVRIAKKAVEAKEKAK